MRSPLYTPEPSQAPCPKSQTRLTHKPHPEKSYEQDLSPTQIILGNPFQPTSSPALRQSHGNQGSGTTQQTTAHTQSPTCSPKKRTCEEQIFEMFFLKGKCWKSHTLSGLDHKADNGSPQRHAGNLPLLIPQPPEGSKKWIPQGGPIKYPLGV